MRIEGLVIGTVVGDKHAPLSGGVGKLVFIGDAYIGPPNVVDRDCVDATPPQPIGDAWVDVLVEQENEAHAFWLSATRASISAG